MGHKHPGLTGSPAIERKVNTINGLLNEAIALMDRAQAKKVTVNQKVVIRGELSLIAQRSIHGAYIDINSLSDYLYQAATTTFKGAAVHWFHPLYESIVTPLTKERDRLKNIISGASCEHA